MDALHLSCPKIPDRERVTCSLQGNQQLLRAEYVQSQTDLTRLQAKMEEQTHALCKEKQDLTAASAETLSRMRQDHELEMAKLAAEHQAALDDSSKALATSEVWRMLPRVTHQEDGLRVCAEQIRI